MLSNTPYTGLGRLLIIVGIVIAIAGVVLILLDRFGLPGRLPGDVMIRGKNWTLWIPLAASLIISIVLTVLLNLFRRH